MSFRGSLSDLSLPDIVQLVSSSFKTGAFVLQSSYQAGEIYLREGQIVHAQVGTMVGEDALLEFAIWQDGDFSFEAGQLTRERTIKKSNTSLLMEAAQRIDEWSVLSKQIPSTQLIPQLTDKTWTTSVSFSPPEWTVICKIDRCRTIEEIAGTVGQSAFDVCKMLYGMVIRGLVELKEAPGHDPGERLREMSRSELALTARKIYELAASQLVRHDRFPEVEAKTTKTLSAIQSGHGVEAVLEVILLIEEVMSLALGPVKARAFTERVHQELLVVG